MADIQVKVDRHCRELNRCNQRGGRMLSVFDLLDMGTLDLELAAYLMAQITLGSSFMVGALPGGAGKTTVMCALLNFLHPDMEIVAATPESVNQANSVGDEPRCYVCHEIGAGQYFSYLWDGDLRCYCGLVAQGHQLVTNLHANDLPEARAQVCEQNGVPLAQFHQFEIMVFLRFGRDAMGPSRRIEKVYASDGVMPHTLVYERPHGLALELAAQEDAWRTECHGFLDAEYRRGTRTVEEVRARVLDFLG